MSWLRVDDAFTSNSKIAQLTDAEFRVWMRLLCHCARAKDPTVDAATMNEVAGLTKARVSLFASLGVIDEIGSSWVVHDWQQYQPKDATGAERQAKWRANRLQTVTPTVTDAVTEPLRSRAGARGVPSRPDNCSTKVEQLRPRDPLWDSLEEEFGRPSNANERGKRNRAVKLLRESGATPDEIRLRCDRYRTGWPHVTLTPLALANNWDTLAQPLASSTAGRIALMMEEEEVFLDATRRAAAADGPHRSLPERTGA